MLLPPEIVPPVIVVWPPKAISSPTPPTPPAPPLTWPAVIFVVVNAPMASIPSPPE